MVKELIHDPIFLSIKSTDATILDKEVANDLLETLIHHKSTCVGMAANMIGVNKRIIAFLDDSGKKEVYTVMFNPEIVDKKEEYVCYSSFPDCPNFQELKITKEEKFNNENN